MNKRHMYLAGIMLLASGWMHAAHLGAKYPSSEPVAQPLSIFLDTETNINSAAIYALSRNSGIQSLANRVPKNRFVDNKEISLLLSTILVNGGTTCAHIVQSVAKGNRDIKSLKRDAKYIALGTLKKCVRGCVKTELAVQYGRAGIRALEIFGFSEYAHDLAQSGPIGQTVTFVATRAVADYAVNIWWKHLIG